MTVSTEGPASVRPDHPPRPSAAPAAGPAAASAPAPRRGVRSRGALLPLLGTVSSSMSDRSMPAQDGTYRILPYLSHPIRQQDGKCPRFAAKGECSEDGDQTWPSYVRMTLGKR
ncbi:MULTISPECIES: hypothetical protein [Streptomyces]|uniref:hypothetical protein n=1 Tax=Streptomyces TaxID=1883 RepID=UPI002F953402